jgi:hypothetical protein
MFFFLFRIFRLVNGIALNISELRGIPYNGIRRIPRNSTTFGVTKFRKIYLQGTPPTNIQTKKILT